MLPPQKKKKKLPPQNKKTWLRHSNFSGVLSQQVTVELTPHGYSRLQIP